MGRPKKINKIEQKLGYNLKALDKQKIKEIVIRFKADNVYFRCSAFNQVMKFEVCLFRKFVSKPYRKCVRCKQIEKLILNFNGDKDGL